MDAAPSRPRDRPMTRVDQAWLRMDRPRNLMTINGVLGFATPLERGAVRELLVTRLLPVPRFRQCLVPSRLPWVAPRWRFDEAFDLDRHLISARLDGDGDDEALSAYMAREMGRRFDFGHSPWRCHLVDGYRGGTAFIWQLHHCVGDGIALMVLLLSLTELGGSPDAPHNPLADLFLRPEIDADEARQDLAQVLPEATTLMVRPVEALAKANPWLVAIGGVLTFLKLALLPPDRRTPLRGRLGGDKRVAWSPPIPLAAVKARRHELDATVTDLLLTATAGGLGRYLEGRGVDTRGMNLRALVPVSLRPLTEMRDLGNRFGLVFLSLPVGAASAAERLESLQERMHRLKRSLQPLVVLKALQVLGVGPRWLHRLVLWIFGLKATAVVTSVPGPNRPLYVTGQAIRDLFFWVPQSAGVGLGISILSYDGSVRVGVASDAARVPDPERLAAAICEELAALGVEIGDTPPA